MCYLSHRIDRFIYVVGCRQQTTTLLIHFKISILLAYQIKIITAVLQLQHNNQLNIRLSNNRRVFNVNFPTPAS